MADDVEVLFLKQFPLTTTDAAGLEANIQSSLSFQPNFVLRSDPNELIDLSAGDLTTTGDVLVIQIAAPSAMPAYTFYPIALTASFVGEVAGTGFWETAALYSIVAPVGTIPLVHAWRSFDMDAVRVVNDSLGTTSGFQSAAPVFQSFPPSPVAAIETIISSLGGFQFTVDTFDAADKAAIKISVDARWLVFPRSAVRNAGFYQQRMFFKTN